MCLALPGKIKEITGDDPMTRQGKADFGGVLKEVNLAYVPEAKIDDYVIIHAGFAISLLDEEEALKTIKHFKEINDLNGEINEAELERQG